MLVALLLLLVYSGISAAISIPGFNIDFAPKESATKDNLDGSMKASNLIDLYTLFILQQMTFPEMPGVPLLPYNQQQTKATARSWRSDVRPALYRANDAIIVFGDYFDTFYDTLHSTAAEIMTNPQSRELFVAVLEELKHEISRQKSLTDHAATKLRTFFDRMTNHSSDLQLDVALLDNATRVRTSEYTYLKQHIDSLDRQIQHYENDLRRTTETVTHTIFFFIPVSSQVTRDTSESQRILNSLLDQRYRAYIRLASLNGSFALAKIIRTEVEKLVSYVKNVINATEALGRAWTQLENDYTTVSDKFASIHSTPSRDNMSARSFGILLQKKLATAKTEWMSLYNYASEIKRSLLAPPILHVVEETSIQ